jgi:hypothetical protein
MDSLEQIRRDYGDNSTANVLKIGDVIGFYEIGLEREDGAVTGSFFTTTPDLKTILKRQWFRIENDGTVTRFPYLPAGYLRTVKERAFVADHFSFQVVR